METIVPNLNPNRWWGACALLVIAMAYGLIATPSAARADTYYYGGYTYYTPTRFDVVTVQTYVDLTSYYVYPSEWQYTGTKTETFTDNNGWKWKIVERTWEVKPGFRYYGYTTYNTQTYYPRLCGRIKWCPHTKMYVFVCECGRTYYYVP